MAVFTGTAGDDSLVGTSGGDDFHLEQGGDDTAIGGGGIDVFYLGATFGSGDQIDGGEGNDILMLDGDYSAGVAFTSTTLVNVEKMVLAGGHSYAFTGVGDEAGPHLKVDGSALTADDSLSVDASGRTKAIQLIGALGSDLLIGGAGNDLLDGGGFGKDTLIGGAGNDELHLGAGIDVAKGGDGFDGFFADGAQFSIHDKLDGGDGVDQLWITGSFAGPLVAHDGTLRNFESLVLQTTGLFQMTSTDSMVATGALCQVAGYNNGGGVKFDGSAETDGTLILDGAVDFSNTLTGGAGSDSISGGNLADTLIGGAGADSMMGGVGDDKLVGGLGQDTLYGAFGSDRYFFLDVQDSTAAAPDLIANLDKNDVIWLQPIDANVNKAGNQAFHLVDAFTGHAGELVVFEDTARHMTTVSGDVDGDGQADLVIQITGNHGDFTSFVL